MYNIHGDLMIIYIDQIIASNVIINLLFIKFIQVLFKEKINIIRIILGLIVSVLSLCLFFVSTKYIYNLRYFVGIVIGIIVFLKKNYKETIIQIVLYYLLNLCFIGTLVIFNVDNTILLYLSSIFVIILWAIESYKSIYIKNKKNYIKVRINKLTLQGFLDTGNTTYCDGIPVVFIKEKYKDYNFIYYKKIITYTITGFKEIDIYKGPLLIKDKKEYVVYYSFVKSLNKELILNCELGD